MNIIERSEMAVSDLGRWLADNAADIALGLIAAAVIVMLLLAARSFGRRMAAGHDGELRWRVVLGRMLAKTGLAFIIIAAFELVVRFADAPWRVERFFHFLFVIAAAFQAAVWIRELVLGTLEARAEARGEASTLANALGIIRLIVSVALFTIAVILILSNIGVDVTGLVAGLGIGGIAIGLAAQGIFKDLFSALAIILDRPFKKGDGIRFDQINGTVENIGLKTTRIRSLEGEEVVVSNANLLEKQIHNFTGLAHRRLVLKFSLVYQTPSEMLTRVPEVVREIVERHEHARLVRCGIVGFGPSGLDFELQFEVLSPDYEYTFATRSAICMEMLAALADSGIQFAYPTTTNFTAAPDGTLVMPWPENPLPQTGGG